MYLPTGVSVYWCIFLVCLSACLCLSGYLSACLPVCLPVYMSMSFYIALYICLICLSLCQSTYLSLSAHWSNLSICESIYLSVYPPFDLSAYLYLRLSVYLPVSIDLSISISIRLYLYLSISLFISSFLGAESEQLLAHASFEIYICFMGTKNIGKSPRMEYVWKTTRFASYIILLSNHQHLPKNVKVSKKVEFLLYIQDKKHEVIAKKVPAPCEPLWHWTVRLFGHSTECKHLPEKIVNLKRHCSFTTAVFLTLA